MELAEPFELTQPAISRHLKVLGGAGLIVRRVEGTKRPCRLAPAAINEIDQWLAMLRQALAKNYDRLDEVLAAMQAPRSERTGHEQADAQDRRRHDMSLSPGASRRRPRRSTAPIPSRS